MSRVVNIEVSWSTKPIPVFELFASLKFFLFAYQISVRFWKVLLHFIFGF